MTVTTTTVRNEYAANGVTITFPFTFKILDREHLIVSLVDDDTGAETGLTYGSDYTILGVGAAVGGSITIISGAPASGTTVVLRRELDIVQPADYSNQGRFYPETHETSFDRLTMLVQQVQDGVDRAVAQPENGSDWYDAHGRRIINLGDAIELTDAVNVQTMNEAIGDALQGVGGYVVPLVWEAVGDGSTTGVNIVGAQIADPKAYHVTIDGLVQVPTTDYTIALATEALTFTSAPPDQAAILIRCVGYAAAVTAQDWDADGNRIINVGAPVAATDAATKDYVDDATTGLAQAVHTHAGSDIVSGVIGPDRLGTGTRTGTRFLRDDGYWTDIDASLALPFTTKGDLLAFDGTNAVRVPPVAAGDGLVLTLNSGSPAGVEWGLAPISGAMFVDSAATSFNETTTITWSFDYMGGGIDAEVVIGSIDSTHLASGAVTNAKIVDGAVDTVKIADGAVTTAKVVDGDITQAKLSATGTQDSTTFLRGDFTYQPISSIPVASHTHATTDITSGLMAPERLGSGYGAIPPGDEGLYYLSADGSWSIPAGGGGGGSGWSNEASQDAVGAILVASPTVTLTYDDAIPSITAAVVAGSIGLTQINTASLDTRYALVGTASALPSGGDANKLLRGDGGTGLWTNVLPGTVYLGSTANALTAGGLSLNIGNVATSSSWNVTTRGGAGTTTFDISAGASGNPLSFGIACTPTAPGENADLFSFQHVPGANPNGYGNLTIITNASFWLPVSMSQTLSVTGAVTAASFTGSIAASNINSGVIGTARLGTGTADNTKFLRGDGTWAVPSSAGSITVADTARIDLTLTGSQVSADIVAGSISDTYLANSAVTATKLAANAVTQSKILDGNVTTTKIGDASVTQAKLANASVGTAQLIDANVTSTKLATGSVTIPKISATGTPSAATFLRGDGAWAAPGSSVLPAFTGARKMLVTDGSNAAAEWTSSPVGTFTWGGENRWLTNGSGHSNEAWFPFSSTSSAGFRMERVCQPANDRSGSMHIGCIRTGGQSQNAWLHVYDIQAECSSAGFFDLGMTSLTYARRMTGSGGSVNAQWLHARSPSIQFSATPDPDGITHTWTGGAVLGAEINYGNSWADIGLVEDRRTSTYVGGLLMVADAVGAPYGGAIDKFHASFGIGFAATAVDDFGRQAKHHIGMYFEENSIAPNGYMIKAWGGSSIANQPSKLMKVQGHFEKGIDFSAATLNGSNQPAISLATGQRIHLGGNAYIWFDGTNIKATNGGSTVTVV